MPDYSDENSEHYDGDYNGKPIVYEEGLHDLFRQKADLTDADRKLLADNELPTDFEGAKAALDEIAETPINLAKRGAGLWNLWVKLNKWRWLIAEDIAEGVKVSLDNVNMGRANAVNFSDGQTLDSNGHYNIDFDNFQHFIFPNISFSKATFTRWAEFTGATFTGWAEFTRATFAAGVEFTGATFTKRAYFTMVTFNGWTEFTRATFTKWASFTAVTFTEGAGFTGATFTKRASFIGAMFTEEAEFTEATFNERADFTRATFNAVCLFNQAVFFADAWLNDTEFHRNVSFVKTYFLAKVSFENAKIDGYADCDHIWFGKAIDTPKPDRYDDTGGVLAWEQELKDAYDAVPVLDSDSINIPNFKGTEFKLPTNLGYTNIPLPPQPLIPREKGDGEVQSAWRRLRRFIGIDQRYIRIKDANAASKFRRLQELAAQGHNHHAEARFFRAELLARRGHEVVNPLRITAINCYELFSECGLSFLRPVGWWAFVFVLFALFAYLPFTRILVFDDPVNIGHLFNYTLSNALPFIGVFRGNDTVAVEVLYGGPAGISFCNSFFAGFHNLISSILLFLALLAVRNYFKMR